MKKPRTINTLYEVLITADPNCALTKTALRRLIIAGTIPSTKIGQKYLVCLEDVEAFLEAAG